MRCSFLMVLISVIGVHGQPSGLKLGMDSAEVVQALSGKELTHEVSEKGIPYIAFKHTVEGEELPFNAVFDSDTLTRVSMTKRWSEKEGTKFPSIYSVALYNKLVVVLKQNYGDPKSIKVTGSSPSMWKTVTWVKDGIKIELNHWPIGDLSAMVILSYSEFKPSL